MLLTLDNLAHRYHCLPSEALARATTFDLRVMDASSKWLNYQQEKANPRNKNKPARKPSTEEMLDMVRAVKETQ